MASTSIHQADGQDHLPKLSSYRVYAREIFVLLTFNLIEEHWKSPEIYANGNILEEGNETLNTGWQNGVLSGLGSTIVPCLIVLIFSSQFKPQYNFTNS